jgi:TPP-dependent pyruvate/acetoin dehydrogenase alpha subunit
VGDTRPPEDLAEARRHDPLHGFARYLRHHGLLDDAFARRMRSRAEREVADAVAYARAAPESPVERAFADVYAD